MAEQQTWPLKLDALGRTFYFRPLDRVGLPDYRGLLFDLQAAAVRATAKSDAERDYRLAELRDRRAGGDFDDFAPGQSPLLLGALWMVMLTANLDERTAADLIAAEPRRAMEYAALAANAGLGKDVRDGD